MHFQATWLCVFHSSHRLLWSMKSCCHHVTFFENWDPFQQNKRQVAKCNFQVITRFMFKLLALKLYITVCKGCCIILTQHPSSSWEIHLFSINFWNIQWATSPLVYPWVVEKNTMLPYKGKKYWLVKEKGPLKNKWFGISLQICVFSGLVTGWWSEL